MITERSTPGTGRAPRRARVLATVSLGAVVAGVLGAAVAGPASATTATVLVAANGTFGTILTTGAGMALYTLDTDHNGQSTCHGSCAAVWPPLDVPAGTVPTGGPGVTGTVGTATQSNGTVQVTYDGAPLYTFVSDTAPGQVTGNNVSGFFVVTVAEPTTTTTTTAPGGGPTGTTSPTGTSASPTPTVAPGPASATAPSSGSTPGVTATAPGALAFTGSGPGLWWLALMGLVLMTLGALVSLGAGRRRAGATAPSSSLPRSA